MGTVKSRILHRLNSYLRNEMSAVDVYALALDNTRYPAHYEQLKACRRSHESRVALLRKQIVRLGGQPAHTTGSWGVLTQVIEGGAIELGEKITVAALEEFEHHDVRRYRTELHEFEDPERIFMETNVLPAQEETYATVRRLKRSLN